MVKVTLVKWTLNYWTPYSFTVTILWYNYGNQGQGHLHVKVIFRSRSLQNQIVSVLIFISKRVMGLRLNAFLLSCYLVAVNPKN